MQCPFCGCAVTDRMAFCPKCGSSIASPASANQQRTFQQQAQFQQQPVAPTPQPYTSQQPYPMGQTSGFPQRSAVIPEDTSPAAQMKKGESQGMKWFKFIIYFQLFANAVLNIANAVLLLTGYVYTMGEASPEIVYQVFPALKPIDMVFGVVFLAVAAYAIYVRIQLAAFKSNAPTLYFVFLGVNVISGLAYTFAVSGVLGEVAIDSSTATQVVTSIALIAINVAYFNNRKHLFVN